ncbi:hypothetical protein [uncultured Pontibacter sp.]|uniref:hypothetical protein n=1 Tax=uncultured Pontibacter sp. TaxID=453356 RepID=UPI00260C317E|nr:hypothetical protein [uncultured Pontibacter sp.]
MKFLLKLKHWQLFLLTWGLPMLVNVFTFSRPELMFQVFPIMMIFFTLGTLGWVWAIATELNQKLPSDVRLNAGRFKVYFSIPILYILGIIIYMAFLTSGSGDNTSMVVTGTILVVLHLLSMVFIFMGLRFAAKTMKTVELGRVTKFGDYVGELFLIWFSIIGCWVLQPRLNKLIEE